jgi:hypothetical protein
VDPAAEATILNANVRPYREGAAAASDEDGRGIDHGAAIRPCPVFVKMIETARIAEAPFGRIFGASNRAPQPFGDLPDDIAEQ